VKTSFVGIPPKRGKFDVRSFYNGFVPYNSTHFPWKIIWQNKATLTAAYIAWTTTLWKILTMDDRRKRLWLTGVVCVGGVGSMWIMFFSIMRSSMPCGVLFSVSLD
jgi:hypothetical protein